MDRDDVEIVGSTELYRGHVDLTLYRLRHRRFAGGWSGEFTRELMHRGNAVGILPYDPLRDEVVLVEQFRIGAYVGDRPPWQVEMICGVIDTDETPEDVARREAVEEADCEIQDVKPICEVVVSPGLTTEAVSLFCGRVDTSNIGGVHGVEGENEDIRAFTLSSEDAFAWAGDGRILHAPTIVALQWLQLNLFAVRKEWG